MPLSLQRPFLRPRFTVEWSLYAVVVAVFAVIAGVALYRSHGLVERNEGDRLQGQARVIGDNLLQQLEGIDKSLVGVAESLAVVHGVPRTHDSVSQRLKSLVDAVPGVRAMLVLDANGDVVAAHENEFIGKNFATRPYFTAPAAGRDPNLLYVSRPFKSSRDTWVLSLTRILTDDQGRFAGVVTAGLDPEYQSVVLRSVLYADDMRVTLVHGDGIVYLNVPPRANTLGSDLAKPGSHFSRHRDSGAEATLSSGIAVSSGEDRIVANRTIRPTKFALDKAPVVHVSRETGAVYVGWRREAALATMIYGVAAALSALLLALSQGRRHELAALRVQARLAREAANRRIQIVTDHTPALIAYIDRSETHRFVNAHYEVLYGTDRESFVGMTMRELLGPHVHAELREHIAGVLAGERQSFERRGRPRGVEGHFMVEYVPDVDADGHVDGFIMLATDITERKDAELRLARSEQMLRAITDNLPALVTHVDAEQRYTFVNGHAKRMLGQAAEAMLGRTMRDVCGDRVYAEFEPHIERVLRAESLTFESTGDAAGGHFAGRHYHTSYIPAYDARGQGNGWYGLTFDVSDRKTTELKLLDQERMLRTMADNLPVLISYFDRSQYVRFINARALSWMGVDPASAIGRPLEQVLGPERYALRSAAIAIALGGERAEVDLETRDPEGARHLHNAYIPVFDERHAVTGVVALSTDMTTLRLAHLKLEELARADPLTGLPNRRQFDERLAETLARGRRDERGMAVLYLDVDHFKSINDAFGHAGGDAALRAFATRLRGCLRATDLPARLGGDEFAVVLEGIDDRAAAEAVATKILEAIRAPLEVEGGTLNMTTSIGIGLAMRPPRAEKELLRCADEALYRAKHAGRDGYRFENCASEADLHLIDTQPVGA